jgi:hypothetical protein
MLEKSCIIAPRSGGRSLVSPPMAEQLHGIAGVTGQRANADQARIKADDVGIRMLRVKFNANFLIEEEMLRPL